MNPGSTDQNAVAQNVRKMDALTQNQIVGRILIGCKGDLNAVKLLVLGEQCKRQTAKLALPK